MTKRSDSLRNSQKKIRDRLKESGKVQFSDWVNLETNKKINELKKILNYRRKGEVIDRIIRDKYFDYKN